MYRELVKSLAFHYNFLARARNKLTPEQMRWVSGFAKAMTENADEVLLSEDEKKRETDAADLEEAVMISGHISEMVELLIRQELM